MTYADVLALAIILFFISLGFRGFGSMLRECDKRDDRRLAEEDAAWSAKIKDEKTRFDSLSEDERRKLEMSWRNYCNRSV